MEVEVCLMARGRVISPDFWSDGNMVSCQPLARLFYVGMWNFAHCDKGHLDDDAMGLKLKILPADQVDPDELLGELLANGRVVRIRADNGKTFLFIPTFEGYQKIDPRWKTRCPACALINSGELTETPVSSSEHAGTPLISALRGENQREEKRTEEERTVNARASVERLFDEAYEHWPKKVERKAALEKFKAAVKRMPVEDLTAHVIRFGDAYAATTERQFTPALGVWLGKERWTDDLPTSAAVSQLSGRSQTGLSTLAYYADQQNESQRGIAQ
jgi:hypothetical protein